MKHQHVVVWVDHRLARIVKFGLSGFDSTVLRSKAKTPQTHHKANSIGDGRAVKDVRFFEQIVSALDSSESILIAGPSAAKVELKNHIDENHPQLSTKIKGVEPLDHPTERELLKFARSYLSAADRMR